MSFFKSKDEKMAEALQESILENLSRTANLVENFSVVCTDGVVSLSGMCDTRKTRKKAILFAEMAEGVTDVQSGDLTVAETEASEESAVPPVEDTPPDVDIPSPAAEPEAASEVEPEARTVSAPVAPKAESQFYTIKSGDSLSKISKEFYGDANKYMLIFEANKGLLKDPNKIFPGQEIRIPPLK